MYFKGDIIITDPCYILTDEDYDNSNYGEQLNKFGFTTYLVGDTGFGDWVNDIYTDDASYTGEFCADSGQVCVVLKSEVEKYNSKLFTYGNHCYATVKDFEGEIILDTSCEKWTVVRGTGNINFASQEPDTDDWEQQYNEKEIDLEEETIAQRLKVLDEKIKPIDDLLKTIEEILEEN